MPQQATSQEQVLWEEISYSASRLAMLYNDRGSQDSVRTTLAYWVGSLDEIEMIEPLQRFIVLHSIQEGRFTEDVLHPRIIWFLLEYERKISSTTDLSEEPWFSTHYPTDGQPRKVSYLYDGFNYYTKSMAERALDSLNVKGTAKLLCEIYANRTSNVVKHISRSDYESTAVREYYDRSLNAVQNQVDFHLGLAATRWMPQGNAEILGVHPGIGFLVGAKHRRYLMNFSVFSKFGDTANTYLVEREDGQIVESRHFIGGFIGLEVSRELFRRGRNEFSLLSGIGLDGFDTLRPAVTGEGGKSIFAFNLNGGFGYRFYIPPFESIYLNLQMRYHLVDYNNSGGTDLSGNVATLRLQFGFLGNAQKNNRLKELGFSY